MSIWGVAKNVITLGGAGRLERAAERFNKAKAEYLRLRGEIDAIRKNVDRFVSKLRKSGKKAKRQLNRAYLILSPLQGIPASRHHYHAAKANTGISRVRMQEISSSYVASSEEHLVGAGIGGLLVTMTAWQGVQVLGTASTGTAIYGLHGIAASNAGWAALGGGSLASGGGGMALGHAVLPGAGIIVALGLGTYTTHKKANSLNRLSQEIEEANPKNGLVLREATVTERQLSHAFEVFEAKRSALSQAVKIAERQLRPFGIFSTSRRYWRAKFGGEYYTAAELPLLDDLERAIAEFLEGLSSSAGAKNNSLMRSRSPLPASNGAVLLVSALAVALLFAAFYAGYSSSGRTRTNDRHVAQLETTNPPISGSSRTTKTVSITDYRADNSKKVTDRGFAQEGDPTESNENPKKVIDAVERWRLAMLSNDPHLQAQQYANVVQRYFLASAWTNDQLLQYLEKLRTHGGFSTFSVRDVVVDKESDSSAEVHFIKDFSIEHDGVSTAATVRTVLHLVLVGGEWKVNYERDFKS